MRIGLIDADATYRGKITYPNLALMKLSAYFKARGDSVMWYPTNVPLLDLPYVDICYISRVFSEPYTKDYTGDILAGEVIRAGSGYAITIENERECYHPELDPVLPPRQSTSTPTMIYTPSPARTAGMPTVSSRAAAPGAATSAMSPECRGDALTSSRTSMNSAARRRPYTFTIPIYLAVRNGASPSVSSSTRRCMLISIRVSIYDF